MMMSRPASERGGTGDRAFLAFKLHRFISGAGHVYATLRGTDQRRVTLDGQRFDPEDPDARLYATFFCRSCGQEHHPVTLLKDGGVNQVFPRPIDETPLEDAEDEEEAGYLMPEPQGDTDYGFTGAVGDYPEDWLETAPRGGTRLRSNRRRFAAREITVNPSGIVGTTGISRLVLAWQVSLLPPCKDQPPSQAREIDKLASLSAEGRSSATTLLVSSVLRWMNGAANWYRRTSASSSASPTIGKMPRFKRATLTISCSCRCCAQQRSPQFERKGRRGLRGGFRAPRAAGPRLHRSQPRPSTGMDDGSRDEGSGPDRRRAYAVARHCASGVGRPEAGLAIYQSEPGGAGLGPRALRGARRTRG